MLKANQAEHELQFKQTIVKKVDACSEPVLGLVQYILDISDEYDIAVRKIELKALLHEDMMEEIDDAYFDFITNFSNEHKVSVKRLNSLYSVRNFKEFFNLFNKVYYAVYNDKDIRGLGNVKTLNKYKKKYLSEQEIKMNDKESDVNEGSVSECEIHKNKEDKLNKKNNTPIRNDVHNIKKEDQNHNKDINNDLFTHFNSFSFSLTADGSNRNEIIKQLISEMREQLIDMMSPMQKQIEELKSDCVAMESTIKMLKNNTQQYNNLSPIFK